MSKRHIKLCEKYIAVTERGVSPQTILAARASYSDAHPPELVKALWRCYETLDTFRVEDDDAYESTRQVQLLLSTGD